MEVTFDIKDLLTEEEIKEECKAAVRRIVIERYERNDDLDRLITNLSYEYIFKAINETTGIDSIQKIKDTVSHLIQQESTIRYELFKPANAWDRSEAVGLKTLHEAIKENIPLIKEKVREAIGNYNFLDRRDLQARMEDTFHDMLEEYMFKNKEE